MRCLINLCWPKNSKVNERKIVMLEALTKYFSWMVALWLLFPSYLAELFLFVLNIKTSHPGVVTHSRDLSLWEEVGREFKASGGYQRYCPSKQQNHTDSVIPWLIFKLALKGHRVAGLSAGQIWECLLPDLLLSQDFKSSEPSAQEASNTSPCLRSEEGTRQV